VIDAPWPYEPMARSDSLDGPRWHCPGGLCECHPLESRDDERREHRIHFFDHLARRLRRPRCRVFENGRLLNVDDPYAEGGILVVRVLPTTSELFLEWAPEGRCSSESGPAGPANLEDGSVDIWTLAPERLSDREPTEWPQPRRRRQYCCLSDAFFTSDTPCRPGILPRFPPPSQGGLTPLSWLP